ncbi:hypothetical protein DB346_13890 [Verrucomicrobia bacterium LW23]|nr:hypothetical protein DB346_13890 [Verrucomicrobia bacterium LW23]
MDINRNLGRLEGILMVDVSGKVYVYVYSELEFNDSSKAVFAIVTPLSGKSVRVHIPETYTAISIAPNADTKDNSDKVFISKYKIPIPAQITQASHLNDLKKSIEKLTSLSRDMPAAAPALTSISKALDLASVLYASGQRYAGGKWLTATEFKAFRSQEILKHFDNLEISSDIKEFLSYYKETIEFFKDSPAVKEQIRSKSTIYAQVHVFKYPSNGLENITETESTLKLTDTEKADFLAAALVSPSMTFETAQPLVEKLKPMAEKTERAKDCYTAWEKHVIISKGVESVISIFLDSMERAASAEASLQGQLNILLSAEKFQAVITASEKPLKSCLFPPPLRPYDPRMPSSDISKTLLYQRKPAWKESSSPPVYRMPPFVSASQLKRTAN